MKKLRLLSGLLGLLVLLAACGDYTVTPVPATTAPAQAQKAKLGDDTISDLTAVTTGGDYSKPLDAIPAPDLNTIYFTATGSKGTGVFRVSSAGGAATEIFTGAPFVSARSLSLTPDGKQLYITDPGATVSGKTGTIFMLATEGGTPTPLTGSAGTNPQNLDVVSQNGQTMIYFSGKDPASGQPALLKLSASGGDAPTVVFKGAPLVEPDGVAVGKSGAVYIADRTAAGSDSGKVFKLDGANLTPIVNQAKLGLPAGIALTKNEAVLVVSAHQMNSPADQVLLVDLSSLQIGAVTKVVGQNQNAGGVHASPGSGKDYFAWSDIVVGGRGRVYRVVP
jgi:hypothetical protein